MVWRTETNLWRWREREKERENLFSPKGKKSLRGWNIFPRPEGRKSERKGRSKEIFFPLFFFSLDGKTTGVFSAGRRIGSKTAWSGTVRQTQGIDVCLGGECGLLSRLFSNGTLVFCLAENVRPVKIFLDVPLFSVTENVIRCRVYWTSHKRRKVIDRRMINKKKKKKRTRNYLNERKKNPIAFILNQKLAMTRDDYHRYTFNRHSPATGRPFSTPSII